ncbi:MAG TPA: HAMP domain-containing sensor histidine kinase [Bacteroidia bacterium]|nr:HAMP domain-containing sensor histidine kinase [Bacteroidia bacterium]HNU33239.1 HAMP domain-containing sensor histidine kinase [Bacteroidia bacterium]
MKIKNKLTLHFVITVATLLFIFSMVIYLVTERYLQNQFLNLLKQKVNITAGVLIKNGAVDSTIVNNIDKHTLNTILNEKILIIDNHSNIHYHSFDGNAHPFHKKFLDEINNNGEAFASLGNVSWYGKSLKTGNIKISLVAEAEKTYLAHLEKLRIMLLTSMLIMLALLFLLGRYFAGRALIPVSNVIHEVESISETNLNKRVNEGNGKDELAQLAKTFNQLLQRLESAFMLQKNFVSNASHELRTPLSSITTQLEVTLLNKRTNEEYEKVLQSVLEDIRNLNELSEGLFDLTLANSDVSMMRFEKIRVDELLVHAQTELQKRKKDYNINVYFDEMPEDENALVLNGKEHLLKSSFINLMDNACKFSGNKKVEVHLSAADNKITIKFKDRGIGIPQSFLKKNFTPLERGHNTARIPGHGLGLALSKKIIELHGGNIHIQSEENKGTNVTIELPV